MMKIGCRILLSFFPLLSLSLSVTECPIRPRLSPPGSPKSRMKYPLSHPKTANKTAHACVTFFLSIFVHQIFPQSRAFLFLNFSNLNIKYQLKTPTMNNRLELPLDSKSGGSPVSLGAQPGGSVTLFGIRVRISGGSPASSRHRTSGAPEMFWSCSRLSAGRRLRRCTNPGDALESKPAQ